MRDPATAQWGIAISRADVRRLKAGFYPQDMDDKWKVWVTEVADRTTVHFVRSWTDTELYVLVIQPCENCGSGTLDGSMRVTAISWEQDKGGIHVTEDQAKKEVVLTSRSLLGCDFEALPEYDFSVIWDYPGAQLRTD